MTTLSTVPNVKRLITTTKSDVQDTFNISTGSMSVGLQNSTGNYVVSGGTTLDHPYLTVQADGTIIVENDLIIRGEATTLNTSNLTIEGPQLNVGLALSNITSVTQITGDLNYALINLETNIPDTIKTNNTYFSGIYVNNTLSQIYNTTYNTGFVFNDSSISLLPNSSANASNVSFNTANNVVYTALTATSTKTILSNPMTTLSTTLPLRFGAKFVVSTGSTVTIASNNGSFAVSTTNGFSNSGMLLLRNSTAIGTFSAIVSTTVLKLTIVGRSISVGDYLAAQSTVSSSPYVLGSVKSIDTTTTPYSYTFNSPVATSTSTLALTLTSNIYPLVPLTYSGITSSSFTGVTYDSTTVFTSDGYVQVYSLTNVPSTTKFYLTGTSSSNPQSWLSTNPNDTTYSYIPVFDNTPTDISLLLVDFCIWKFTSVPSPGTMTLSAVNGKMGLLQQNNVADGTFNLKFNFTDGSTGTYNDVSKSISCSTAATDSMYFTKKVNNVDTTYFTLDYANEKFNFNNGAYIQNNANGTLNITSVGLTGAAINIGAVGTSSAINMSNITNVTNSTASTSSLNGALVVSGGAGIAGSINIGGNENVYGNLGVTGTTTIGGNTLILSNSNIAGNLGVTGTTTIGGNTLILSNSNIAGNLGVTGTSILNGNTTINGTLGVTGTATIGGNSLMLSNANVAGNLGVTGNTLINGNLGVTGSTLLNGNTTINGTLGVTGTATIGGNSLMLSNANVAGNLGVTGNTLINGNLGVTGTTLLNGNTVLNGTLGVTGTATIGGNTLILSNSNIAGNLGVTGTSILNGNTTINGTLGVTGTATIGGNSLMLSNANVAGNLGVTGNTLINGTLGVTGTATIGGVTYITSTNELTGITGGFTGGSLVVNGSTQIYKDLNVIGSIYTKEFVSMSDKTLKKNITTIDNALDKVLEMRGVYFNWIDEQKYGNDQQIGFIAQEINEIFPQLVNSNGSGALHVNYSQTTAILVEAIKAQNILIKELQDAVAKLQQ